MKTASALLNELVVHVHPPRGCKIYLTKLTTQTDRNWYAGCSNMGIEKSDRYSVKLVELLKTDPIVDWTGQRHLIWSSEDDNCGTESRDRELTQMGYLNYLRKGSTIHKVEVCGPKVFMISPRSEDEEDVLAFQEIVAEAKAHSFQGYEVKAYPPRPFGYLYQSAIVSWEDLPY